MSADPLGRFALLAAIDRAAVAIDPRLFGGSRHADHGSERVGRIEWPRHRRALRIGESDRHFSLADNLGIDFTSVNGEIAFALDRTDVAAYLCEAVRRKVQLHRPNASRDTSPRTQDALSWLKSQGTFYACELGVPSGEGITP
jgi:hypothetical protein